MKELLLVWLWAVIGVFTYVLFMWTLKLLEVL